MFCCQCISIHPCNDNQLEALFILSLLRQSTSTCFGNFCSPSSGSILYIYKNWYVTCFSVGCLLSVLGRETVNQKTQYVRGGADKSLARPNPWCRRTESIVSLERGVCSCAELQVFSCYRDWKEACHVTRAISTSRRELSSSFFFLQGKVPKEIHAILTEILVEYAPSYATVKNWVAQFKRGDFYTCEEPRPGRPETVTTRRLLIKFTRQSWKTAGFRLNQ